MTFLVIWIIASIAVGFVAGERGRSSIAWFLMSFLLSPLLGILLLIACPVVTRKRVKIPWTKFHTRALMSFGGGVLGFVITFSLIDAHPDAAMVFVFPSIVLFLTAIVYLWRAWAPVPASPGASAPL